MNFNLAAWFRRVTTINFFPTSLIPVFYSECALWNTKQHRTQDFLGYITGQENCLSVLTQGHRYFLIFLHLVLGRFPWTPSAFLLHSWLPFLFSWNRDVDFFPVPLTCFLSFVLFLLLLKRLISLKDRSGKNGRIKPRYPEHNEDKLWG